MTMRHAGYIITLDTDIREDDAKAVITALMQIRGIIGVKPIEADVNLVLACVRAKHDLFNELMKIVML